MSERTLEIDRERRSFEAQFAQKRDRLKVDCDLRQSELQRVKDMRKKEFLVDEKRVKEEFGAVSTDIMQQNRDSLAAIDAQMFNERRDAEDRFAQEEQEARMQFNRTEDVKKAEVQRRKNAGAESISRIREELEKKLHSSEKDWQYSTVRWLSMAKRKVVVKKEEDEKARQGRKKRAGAN